MRTIFGLILALTVAPVAAESLDEFRVRIESAFGTADGGEAVRALFYQEGLDQGMQEMLDGVVRRIVPGSGARIRFVPVPDEARLVAVVDGYEYRPNLDVVGYVDLGPNDMGGTTRAPYGEGPDGRYYLTATTRRLVAPDAEPDRQLQMIVIGMGSPPVTFEGWCDILQGDGRTFRVRLNDEGVGNRTVMVGGQAITACEVTNTAGRGVLSLRLIVGDEQIFERRVEAPEGRIVFDG